MRKSETINTFSEGMIMDLNPSVTPNNTLVNCLNGTLVTFLGNENVLQNDMGNGRVETAFLPLGYIPLGTALLGRIIYIVSYNPDTSMCLVGSFPSPERNLTSDKLVDSGLEIALSEFTDGIYNNEFSFIKSPYQKLILTNNIILHPGDKFLIYFKDEDIGDIKEYLSAFNQEEYNPDLSPRYLKLNVVAITDNGKMTNLNHTLVWQPVNGGNYYIKDNYKEGDFDEYRDFILPNYSTFQTRTSGKLGIVAELECIDSFNVAWDALKNEEGYWDIYLYTNWTYKNDFAKDKINLYGIYYKLNDEDGNHIIIDDYPTSEKPSDTDIKGHQDAIFYNPPYFSDIKDYLENKRKYLDKCKQPRNNDGTDNLFLISTPISCEGVKEMANLKIMPLMPFGILKWLEQNISINLSKIGTGLIDLVLYKYYVEEETILLSWGLEAYPELNKTIKEVTFNFYELGSDILNNLGEQFDNNRVYNNKWEGTDEPLPNLSDIKKTIINKGKPSYSGYFTEIFNREDLTNNYVYLVEITIQYDDNQIKYYRVFYNSTIFNDFYYKEDYNDFKTIKLDDVISEQIAYNLDIETLINENLTEFEESVSPITEDIYTEFLKYNIIHKHLGKDIGVVSVTVNDVFNATIDNINVSEKTHEYTNNALALLLSDSSISSSVSLDEITGEYNNSINSEGNTITNDFEYNINIPLLMTYTTKTPLNVSYELVHATCTYRWMIYRGRDKYHHLSLYPDIINIGTDDYYDARDEWGDNTRKSGTMKSTYTNCYSYLSLLLDTYDIVALPTIAVRGVSGKGNESVSLGFKIGANINVTKEYLWTSALKGCLCGLFYAMKNLDGSVIVFSFDGVNCPDKIVSSVELEKSASLCCLRANAEDISHITDSLSYEGETIPYYILPLAGYYIPKEHSEAVYRYHWTLLEYYSSFTETSSHTIKGTSDITLFINSLVELNPGIKVNNLYYTKNRNLDLSYNTSWEIPTSNLISLLTGSDADVYVMLPGGILSKDITVGRNNVYDIKGNRIPTITNWISRFLNNIPIVSELKSSILTMTLCVTDEKLRIKQNMVGPDNTGDILGISENLNIRITQIPIIPYEIR